MAYVRISLVYSKGPLWSFLFFYVDTPKRYRLLHVALWLYCFCGMWAILASHGHYTLDVVIAFYIASRVFMYHQTFANNLSLMRRNRKRIKIWFPVFYFFEKDTHGIVKNEYECPLPSLDAIRKFIKDRRVDFCLKQYTAFRHSWCSQSRVHGWDLYVTPTSKNNANQCICVCSPCPDICVHVTLHVVILIYLSFTNLQIYKNVNVQPWLVESFYKWWTS